MGQFGGPGGGGQLLGVLNFAQQHLTGGRGFVAGGGASGKGAWSGAGGGASLGGAWYRSVGVALRKGAWSMPVGVSRPWGRGFEDGAWLGLGAWLNKVAMSFLRAWLLLRGRGLGQWAWRRFGGVALRNREWFGIGGVATR